MNQPPPPHEQNDSLHHNEAGIDAEEQRAKPAHENGDVSTLVTVAATINTTTD